MNNLSIDERFYFRLDPPRSMLSMTTDAFPPSQTTGHAVSKNREPNRSG